MTRIGHIWGDFSDRSRKDKTRKKGLEDKIKVYLPNIPITRTGPEIPKVVGDVLIPLTPEQNSDVLIQSTSTADGDVLMSTQTSHAE